MKKSITAYKPPATAEINKTAFQEEDIEKLFSRDSIQLDQITRGPVTNDHLPVNGKLPRMTRRMALQIELNIASSMYQMRLLQQEFPKPYDLQIHWQTVASSSRKLMTDFMWMPKKTWDGIPNALRAEISILLMRQKYQNEEEKLTLKHVVEALHGVELLNKIALALEKKNSGKKNKKENLVSAEVDLFIHLDMAFERYSGLKRGKVDFIHACLEHLHFNGIRKKAAERDSVQTLLKRYKKDRAAWVSRNFPEVKFLPPVPRKSKKSNS